MSEKGEPRDEQSLSAPEPIELLEAAFEKHGHGLWRFVLRLTGSQDEADEVVQETFGRAVKGRASFRGGNVSTWLYAIALNVVRSRARASRGTTVRLEDETAASREPEPSESAQTAESGLRVRAAIERLPEPQKVAVLLSRFQGLPYEEIAKIEECSVDAVKQRMRRAMERLREDLKDLT